METPNQAVQPQGEPQPQVPVAGLAQPAPTPPPPPPPLVETPPAPSQQRTVKSFLDSLPPIPEKYTQMFIKYIGTFYIVFGIIGLLFTVLGFASASLMSAVLIKEIGAFNYFMLPHYTKFGFWSIIGIAQNALGVYAGFALKAKKSIGWYMAVGLIGFSLLFGLFITGRSSLLTLIFDILFLYLFLQTRKEWGITSF